MGPPPTSLPPIERLLELATDVDPLVGHTGVARHLGPWTALLQRGIEGHRAAIVAAVASAALLQGTDRCVPVRRSMDRNEVPAGVRAGVHALRQAPLSCWRVSATDTGFWLEDLVGLRADCVPTAPVRLWGALGRVAGDCGLWLGRAVETEQGWFLATAFAVPRDPGNLRLQNWVAAVTDTDVHPTVALCRRGDVLCRRVMSWAYSGGG